MLIMRRRIDAGRSSHQVQVGYVDGCLRKGRTCRNQMRLRMFPFEGAVPLETEQSDDGYQAQPLPDQCCQDDTEGEKDDEITLWEQYATGEREGQRRASRAEMHEHPGLMVPGEDPVWGELGDAAPNSRTSGPDAILQPPRPEIIPSERLLQLAAEHDSEPDREAAD